MLYPKSKEAFSEELFLNPTSEYRGTPFWAWNGRMTKENIKASIEVLDEMGMGGGHIHSRTGLANTYLGEEFMQLVLEANKEFTDRSMLTWLYDEDRWPSGAGGGYVTRDHEYRMRFLVFSPVKLSGDSVNAGSMSSSGQEVRSTERDFLARYGVSLTDGWLYSYRMIGDAEPLQTGEQEWFAYQEVSGDNPWFNNQAYLNTLDKKAVEKFIEVTHEAYYKEFGGEFGKTIPAIFTDEPQFSHKKRLQFADDRKEIILPYTDDLEDTFMAEYGQSLKEHLPELFWELPDGKVSQIRYEYHDHIAERFTSAFADTIGSWCTEHHILLAGHMMEEPTLRSQTAALGEAMRSYRSFTLPGIDMLCDWRELSTAKQAQSAAHQYAREGVLSELYGVTNWDFDFKGHKLQGDWQAALGVTVRVPHLMWTSMAGEAKRDYPASIGRQSPWYKEYPYIENYFGRLNTVLTRGHAEVRIGIIHPIESYWLYWGTEEKTGAIRNSMDEDFDALIRYMLYGLLDFDFIAESLLPELTKEKEIADGRLQVGAMAYDVIVVPNAKTLRSTTINLLERLIKAGGRVIFVGNTPDCADAVPCDRVTNLVGQCEQVPFNKTALTEVLEAYRFLDIQDETGNRTENLVYQLRTEADQKWLFIAHVNKMKNQDVTHAENLKITLSGTWDVTVMDAVNASMEVLVCKYSNGKTILNCVMYEQDSLLLALKPKKIDADIPVNDVMADSAAVGKVHGIEHRKYERITAEDTIKVKLEEPNVIVLDQAEYRFDNGAWEPSEEILRIDNKFRELLGYPLRMEAFAQPWIDPADPKTEHKLSLRIHLQSEVDITKVYLGMEESEEAEITWNGEGTRLMEEYYIDPCIRKVELGPLHQGENELLITIPYHQKRNIEAMYLLGDFGVRVRGSVAIVTEPVRALAFGDIAGQGLPFYGGTITYQIDTELKSVRKDVSIKISKFRAPVLKVIVDGIERGYIAYSPYCLNIGDLHAGKHRIEILMFGSRINTLGTLHNCNENTSWFGPNAWRTIGDSWSYEYQLHRTGILKAPEMSID
jgi:hypothetical protein